MIITIDGPAGSGKSTAARCLAERLGIAYLDTGAMYRAVTLKALRAGADFADAQALVQLARETEIELESTPEGTRVLMDGADVSEAIRSMEVSSHTNPVAANQGVRDVLVEKQRHIGHALGSVVTEGRDQGSVVFPDADLKVLLDASDIQRAQRRCLELQEKGEPADFEAILENVRSRDENDRRQWEPLLASGEAVRVDTTDMDIEQVLAQLVDEVDRRRSAGRAGRCPADDH